LVHRPTTSASGAGRSEFHELLAGAFADVELEERALPWPCQSPTEAVDWLATHSPQHVAAFTALGDAAPGVREHMAEIVARELGDTAPRDMALPWLKITARRR